MLDLKQVEAVFTIIWPQQDWNGGDEGFCRAVAEKVVRTLQAAGPEPVAWRTAPDILLDQIAAIRDEYLKLRSDCLDQMEWHASQGDSEETGDFSTEAERHGAALLACNRILKLSEDFKEPPPAPIQVGDTISFTDRGVVIESRSALVATPPEERVVEVLDELGLEIALEDAAKAAFVKAQSVYRGDHDHFPLTTTWETTIESVREGWRSIAYAAVEAAHIPPLGTRPEPRNPRDLRAALATKPAVKDDERVVEADAVREALLDAKEKLRVAFRKALSELPEIAPAEIKAVLSSVHMRKEFINEGKRLQLEHGTDAVAPRVEQEYGAGAWSFMRSGVLTALAAKPAVKDDETVVEALPLREIRRRVRNIWGAISSNQVIDKDVEGQSKRLLADIDAALAAKGGRS